MGKVGLYDYPMLTLFNPTPEEINKANEILGDKKGESSTNDKNLVCNELYERIINLTSNIESIDIESINEIRKLSHSLKKANHPAHNKENQRISTILKTIDAYLALIDSTEVRNLCCTELNFLAYKLMEIIDPLITSSDGEPLQDVGLIHALLS